MQLLRDGLGSAFLGRVSRFHAVDYAKVRSSYGASSLELERRLVMGPRQTAAAHAFAQRGGRHVRRHVVLVLVVELEMCRGRQVHLSRQNSQPQIFLCGRIHGHRYHAQLYRLRQLHDHRVHRARGGAVWIRGLHSLSHICGEHAIKDAFRKRRLKFAGRELLPGGFGDDQRAAGPLHGGQRAEAPAAVRCVVEADSNHPDVDTVFSWSAR